MIAFLIFAFACGAQFNRYSIEVEYDILRDHHTHTRLEFNAQSFRMLQKAVLEMEHIICILVTLYVLIKHCYSDSKKGCSSSKTN